MSKFHGFFVVLILLSGYCIAQQGRDSATSHADTAAVQAKPVDGLQLLEKNQLLNYKATPVAFISDQKHRAGKELIFYILAALLFFFGFLKVFYARYFNHIFRIYFNTSLRQSQLTDTILQAKLSSLLYNIFFFLSGGVYLYFLLNWFKLLPAVNPVIGISVSVLIVSSVYLVKYFGLLFIGWLSGMESAAGIYIFITFLINKILGICLLPFLLIIAFSEPSIVHIAVIASLVVTGVLFVSRYLRSYGLLERDLKISRFHFLVYIFALEILPLLLIYKALFFALKYL